jgi:CRISPR-associated protein Csx3
MASVELQLFPNQKTVDLTYQHLRIRLTTPHGIIEPSALSELTLPPLVGSQGIVLEGRAPIWLYGCLIHACHASVWVACFDPRLGDDHPQSGGAVVVASHSPQVSVGQVLTVYLPEEQS